MAWRAGNQKLTVHKLKTCGNSSHCSEVVEAQLARSTVDSRRYILPQRRCFFHDNGPGSFEDLDIYIQRQTRCGLAWSLQVRIVVAPTVAKALGAALLATND